VTGGWKKFHNEAIYNLYSSPQNIRVIKLRRMRWVGHVASMGEMKNEKTILLESLKGRDHS
jgi:hypothetical protein